MKEVKISTFKAQCLSLLDEVSRTKEGLMVTRHGKPLVTINPVENKKLRKGFGIAKGTIEIKGNIIAPATDISDWEAFS
jgi:prevent-host-death family protein